MPENILSLKEVKERKSEIEYSFCNISCPQTNKKGLKNIIGKFSDFKINRIYTYELQTVIISCSEYAFNSFLCFVDLLFWDEWRLHEIQH